MTTNDKLVGCRDISIYLGNVCNFNCSYCDRDYIKTSIGGQFWSTQDTDKLIEFLHTVGAVENPPEMFSFHGGEPFAYVKIMDKVIESLDANIPGNWTIFIQTNGSLIRTNEWFFEKWGSRLSVSISYDFLFQEINRSVFGISEAIDTMKRHNVKDIQFQYVMPINNPKVFGLPALKAVTDVCIRNNVRKINLIPLRHIRGQDNFRLVIDEIDLNQWFGAFLKFIQMLYVMDIDVYIDGHLNDIDKHYFDNHKQMILSPDGNIYPEYDFLEYKRQETVIGRWKDGISINRTSKSEDHLLLDECKTCPSRDSCGLKYLYTIFEREPNKEKCTKFYQMMDVAIKHTQKLKQQPSIFHWVGI